MKFLPNRGTFPQLKDYDMRHILRFMVRSTEQTWKQTQASTEVMSVHLFAPKVKYQRILTDRETGKPLLEITRFYFKAFGERTPVKIARGIMQKLLKKGYIELSGETFNTNRRSERWRFLRYRITYKGFMYLHGTPIGSKVAKAPAFNLLDPKIKEIFEAYLQKRKEEGGSIAELGGPDDVRWELLKSLKEGRITIKQYEEFLKRYEDEYLSTLEEAKTKEQPQEQQ